MEAETQGNKYQSRLTQLPSHVRNLDPNTDPKKYPGVGVIFQELILQIREMKDGSFDSQLPWGLI